MTAPRLVDVRDGLTQEVVEDLRLARRVSLAIKDARTAALGYWVETTNSRGQPVEQLRIALLRCEGVGEARLPAQPARQPQGVVLMFPRPLAPLSGVLLDVADAPHDVFWGRVVGLLRPGDVIRVGRDWSSGAWPALRIGDGKTTFAWLRLPSKRLLAGERPAA
jgi:hypothetical protein